ncbi:MAG: ABC transporter permease [Gemmatimonas sp.]
MRQIKLAFRTLFRSPFVTIIAILSLGLGIGANAAIYSMFNQMLLKPLPVSNPTELVNLGAPSPKPGSQSCSQAGSCDDVFSYPMYRDLERSQQSFTGLAAHRGFGAAYVIRQQAESAEGMLVSGSYFPTLGIKPALGRLFTQADDDKIGNNFVVVLSYSLWQSRLGGDPKILDEQITVNGKSMRVIGVAPKDFTGTTMGSQPKVYVPISMRAQVEPFFTLKGFENRQSYWIYVFGRLKPGVTLEQAKTATNALYAPIISSVEAPLQKGMSDATMAKFLKKKVTILPGPQGQSSLHERAKTPLYLLLGVTGIVLLIACANIANLLLARGANRSMEMSVRLALGASRGQLLFQLITESVLLALLGGVASLLVAKLTLTGIAAILPDGESGSLQFALQPAIIGFTAALSIGTGLLFGMFPALHSTRPDLVTSIRANAGQISGARAANRFRSTLVTVQIALSMSLLICAGLFIKSLMNVSNVDLGLKVENVVTFEIAPELSGYDNARSAVLFHRVEEELAAIPGVTGVTSSLVPLIASSNWGNNVHIQGIEEGPDTDMNSRFNEVGAGYFKTLVIPVKAGREFIPSDAAGGARVAIVNEEFIKKFKLGSNVVGRYISNGSKDSLNIQIVGIAKNSAYSSVKDTVPPIFFLPWMQDKEIGDINFYVRTSLPMDQILKQIPALMKRLDPNLPLDNVHTMTQQIKENVSQDRMISILSALFASLATLLAGVGLYGVLAYTVAQRTREIGVRMALGADSSRVKQMVLRQVGGMMLVGGVVGIAGAFALGRIASSKELLYGLKGYDPVVFVLATLLIIVVGLVAGYLPAHRASKVHPMQALRYE